MAARRVLLLTNELATASAVGAALESNGKLRQEDVCRDFRELTERLQQTAATVALVDIDDAPGSLATLDGLVRRFGNTRFIVLSRVMDSQRLLEAMQIGARHYVVKDGIKGELSGVLHRVAPEDAGGGGGAVYTILSAGGGCGATTLAVNLADELQLAMSDNGGGEGRALIVDLDTIYGSVGSYLGVDGEYGILDLLARNGPLDGHLVETSTVAYGERRLHALVSTSSAHLGEPVGFDPARLSQAVSACASAYPATVIDAPRVGTSAAAELVHSSDVTLLLMQLTVKDIRAARRMLGTLVPGGNQVGTGARGSVTPVISRYARRGAMITLDEAKRALGGFEVMTLPNDYPAAAQSLNLGKPLSASAPRSELRRAIQQLATKLTAAHAKQSATSSSSSPQLAGAKR